MGKVRTKIVGDEEAEKKQKAEQKAKSAEKKAKKDVIANEVKQSSSDEIATTPTESRDDVVTVKKEKKAKTKVVETTSKHGKKYAAAQKLVEKGKFYTISEAISVLKKAKYAKFEESVEVHVNVEKTGLKGEVELPHSTGKTTRVAVVSDELLKDLESGTINFDILVTHPSFMPKLAKFAKLLGPRGLMPNPKSGTISTTPEELVKKFTGGAIRWKTEPKFPIIHQMVGKVSLDDNKIAENVTQLLKSVGKGNILNAYLTTTMGPAVKLQVDQL
jgi:ribosomal protein L1